MRKKMNPKIIFFDIDGTIFSNTSNQISDNTQAAIRSARENGHLAFINTGRAFAEINKEILEVGFDGYICGCGTYIAQPDNLLYETTLSQETLQEIIKDLRKLNIYAILEGSKALYIDFDRPGAFNDELLLMPYFDQFQVLDWNTPEIHCGKFTIWSETREDFQCFYKKYKNIVDFIEWDQHLCEVVVKGHSKATGIQYLISHLGISYENTFAIGDGFNDLPMLEFVNHSIGMGNAPEEVKDIVSFVTKDVEDEGVVHALKHFNLI